MKLKLFVFCCVLQSIMAASIPDSKVPGAIVPGGIIGYPPLSSFIVGGTDAPEGIAPYQCSIQRNGGHYCGCSIVNKKFIVSAAHCLGGAASSVSVIVGTNNLASGGTVYKAEKLITHEQYDNPPFAYDIGLIQVEGEIAFNEKVQPIKLSNKTVAGDVALQTTGWGRLSAGGPIPQKLQLLKVNSVDQDACIAIHGSTVHPSHICTYSKAGEGVCSGDSGGPLVLDGELVGVTNWAVLCARGYPDGFARVSYLYDWVASRIGNY